jgi:mannitol-1-/sugar-/sorbitol-6-phosphatase
MILALLPGLPPARLAEYARSIRRAEREQVSNVTALPGSVALLSRLPLNSWAIVTSNDRDVALARIRAACIPMPSVLLSSDEIERAKPDPQGLLLAASKLNAPADNVLVVDDSSVGIEAAARAGMQSVAIRFKNVGRRSMKASLTVDNLSCLKVEEVPDGFLVEVGQGI